MTRTLFYNIIVANLFQSLVSLLWIAGLRRLLKPFPADLHAQLLRAGLVLPFWIAILRILQVPSLPEHLLLVRVEQWSAALQGSGPLAHSAFFLFLTGVALIFIFQEFVPMLSMLKRRHLAGHAPDSRLDRILERVNALYEKAGIASRPLSTAFRIPLSTPLAALHGLRNPVLVVSDNLLGRLDDLELEGVIAHERAHLFYGGNLRMFLTWAARAMQAFNPLSLVLFRELTEIREQECDALAARVTAKPKVLAKALLKFDEHHGTAPDAHSLKEAEEELRERAEHDETRARFDALTAESAPGQPTPRALILALTFILGGMLWAIA